MLELLQLLLPPIVDDTADGGTVADRGRKAKVFAAAHALDSVNASLRIDTDCTDEDIALHAAFAGVPYATQTHSTKCAACLPALLHAQDAGDVCRLWR